MPARIAIIDDELAVRELLASQLKAAGFECHGYGDGRKGLDAVTASPPDLVLLDIGLPGMDGLAVCRAIRGDPRLARLPVVMLTGLLSDANQVLGLEVGADDYVTKPWKAPTLVARIRAVLRRSTGAPGRSPIPLGPVTLDPGRREATLEGRPLALRPIEFRILELLAAQRGRALTRAELMEEEEGEDHDDPGRSVDVHVYSLRRKLGPWHGLVETVHGYGYRLGSSLLEPGAGTGAHP